MWCISMYHVTSLKQTCGIKKVTLKAAKEFAGVAVYWYSYDLHRTNVIHVVDIQN